MLIVNDGYLAEYPLRGADNTVIQPSDSEAVRVLLPQRYVNDRAEIIDQVRHNLERLNRGRREPLPPIRTELLANQQVLNFSITPFEPMLLDSPIVVVVPEGSGIVSAAKYQAWATNEDVIVTDPSETRRSLRKAGLSAYVPVIESFVDHAADALRESSRALRMEIFNAVAAAVVLLITAIGVSLIYCRRTAQSMFVKFIAGWGFLRIHRWFLAAEAGLAVLLVAGTWQSARDAERSRPAWLPDPALTLGGELTVASGVAAGAFALVVFVLARTAARVRRAQSASLA